MLNSDMSTRMSSYQYLNTACVGIIHSKAQCSPLRDRYCRSVVSCNTQKRRRMWTCWLKCAHKKCRARQRLVEKKQNVVDLHQVNKILGETGKRKETRAEGFLPGMPAIRRFAKPWLRPVLQRVRVAGESWRACTCMQAIGPDDELSCTRGDRPLIHCKYNVQELVQCHVTRLFRCSCSADLLVPEPNQHMPHRHSLSKGNLNVAFSLIFSIIFKFKAVLVGRSCLVLSNSAIALLVSDSRRLQIVYESKPLAVCAQRLLCGAPCYQNIPANTRLCGWCAW